MQPAATVSALMRPVPMRVPACSVLFAPMGFFLMTPVGDLLLNFTKDQDIMDENLPDGEAGFGDHGTGFGACARRSGV